MNRWQRNRRKIAEISEDEFEDSEAGDFGMGCCGGY